MQDELTLERVRGYRKTYAAMLISSLLSLLASLVLSVEAIDLAKNSAAKFTCDINAIVSCGKVARAWQANLFGFPNSFLGLICEPVVIAVAVAGLGRVLFPKWFMRTALVIYGAGLIFAFWLLSQSFFVIKAFCPWCLLVTVSTVTVFATMLRLNIMENVWNLSEATHERWVNFLNKGWGRIVYLGIYSILFLAILFKYGHALLPS